MTSTIRVLLFCLVAGLVSLGALEAETSFWMRNTDLKAVFYYWTVDGGPRGRDELLPLLPLASGGRHGIAPGERVRVVLGDGKTLVGVFVPWSENLSFRSPVSGGFLTAAEVPSRGTLQVDRPRFAAANGSRGLSAPLQAWGLTVPQFVLDGAGNDWTKVPVSVEWGTSFLPGNQPWPSAWPRPLKLQAVSREGSLWVRFTLRAGSFPLGTSVSLALRRPGALLEWPLTGKDGTVWSWTEGAAGVAVGWRVLQESSMEAWVPWDRLGSQRVWLETPSTWSLLVTEGDVVRSLELAPVTLEDLP